MGQINQRNGKGGDQGKDTSGNTRTGYKYQQSHEFGRSDGTIDRLPTVITQRPRWERESDWFICPNPMKHEMMGPLLIANEITVWPSEDSMGVP